LVRIVTDHIPRIYQVKWGRCGACMVKALNHFRTGTGGEALQNFEKAKLKLLRPFASLLAPGGKQTRLWILIYHRVLLALDEIIPDVPDATQFRWQIELL